MRGLGLNGLSFYKQIICVWHFLAMQCMQISFNELSLATLKLSSSFEFPFNIFLKFLLCQFKILLNCKFKRTVYYIYCRKYNLFPSKVLF